MEVNPVSVARIMQTPVQGKGKQEEVIMSKQLILYAEPYMAIGPL